ncbi:Sec-independent protein translocase subunit TatA/TatB [Blattabacterium cuenoti]|uniref:Sec-independent protein translocase subunit TatA/TatB n=1 Tax=Blattabacterium cuenoti TaxID=1653831 RepID=UPI00163C2A31|nr:twin-arginine translocase TatA/TatE family subunit [Blattabacterium cuenoti]
MKNLLFISIEESFFIIFIAVIIFGPKRIPDIARGLGEGIRYMKILTNKIKNEIMQNNYKINTKKDNSKNKDKKKPHYSVKR